MLLGIITIMYNKYWFPITNIPFINTKK
jgi:hypothetical protein